VERRDMGGGVWSAELGMRSAEWGRLNSKINE
jgi:hypothetical protein